MKLHYKTLKFILLPLAFLFHNYCVSGQQVDTASIIAKAEILNNYTYLLIQDKKIDSARMYIDSTLEIISANIGVNHSQYAIALNYLGTYYIRKQEYAKSADTYRRAIDIAAKVMAQNDINYIRIKVNLGNALLFIANYEESEMLFLSAKKLLLETPNYITEPDYSKCVRSLFWLYDGIGRFEEALQYAKEYSHVIEIQKGKHSHEYGMALGNEALTYANLGLYNNAEKSYLLTLQLLDEKGKKSSLEYAGILINFAVFYKNIGRTNEAEISLLHAKDIFENILIDTLHPWYANCIYNFAKLYQDIGLYDKSLPFVKKVISLDEIEYGNQNPKYAAGLELLFNIYLSKDKLDSAELLIRKSLEIKQNSYGYVNYNTAITISKLARFYQAKKHFNEAFTEYKNCLEIFSTTVGKDHILYLNGLLYYIQCRYSANPNDSTIDSLILASAELNRRKVFQATKFMTENELIQYVNRRENATRWFLAWKSSDISSTAGSAYDDILLFKGLLVNNISNVKYKFGIDSSNLLKLDQLKSYHWRLANYFSQPVKSRDSASMQDLADKANSLEKELTRNVAEIGESIKEIHWTDLKLKTNEVAIEIIQFDKHPDLNGDTILYGALVLSPLESKPIFIPLFNKQEFEATLNQLNNTRSDALSDLYQSRSSKLYDLLWKPLIPHLHDAKTIYYSPNGLLHRINLHAVPINDTTVISDKYAIVQLGSTRELTFNPPITSRINDCALFGGITYEVDTTDVSVGPDINKYSKNMHNPIVQFSQTENVLRGGSWSYLNGSGKEVNFILPILKDANFTPSVLRDVYATEENFKALSRSFNRPYSPRIIHLSTHGYFFPDPKIPSTPTVFSDLEPVFKTSDHPMIRSGLILAGGNYAWKHGHPYKPGMEDGILTAYEISQMDLNNTELVVLSACETGLGAIRGNEGVYGLQRAFKIAGVKNLIMSLWKVPDAATAELMISFYKHWLEDKMTIRQALYTAQKELRDEGFEPYYWAGWVLIE